MSAEYIASYGSRGVLSADADRELRLQVLALAVEAAKMAPPVHQAAQTIGASGQRADVGAHVLGIAAALMAWVDDDGE